MCAIALALVMTTVAADEAASASGDAAAVREIRQALAAAGFEFPASEPQAEMPFRIVSAEQDYGRATPDRCCHTFTPLRIGSRTFAKGIGAHANGRIAIELIKPFKRFTAGVGIDNNDDTQGVRGSAQFVVSVDGKQWFQSPILVGGQEPAPVDVDLTGATRLELVVRDGGDGVPYDQADWAEAVLEAADGARHFVGDALSAQVGPLLSYAPTSFAYGGQDCWGLFRSWRREEAPASPLPGGTQYSCTWTDPASGFQATLIAIAFDSPPALELQWRFKNAGAKPSELITDAFAIDLHAPSAEGRCVLESCSGGLTGGLGGEGERLGFELSRTPLGQKTLTVNGGRSSNGDLPFFRLERLSEEWGMALALGWSGQWRANAAFDATRKETSFRAGLDPVHFRLPPGESVTLPRALFIPYRGDASGGTNRLRRLLRDHYQGRLDGRPALAPVSFNSWFVFDNRVNAAMLGELADAAAPLGIEYFCLDAGWFDGDFANGVGNWTINRTKFPDGLKPVADHVHSLSMKFGLWFEPERVAPDTRWFRDHAGLLFAPASPGGAALVDLGKPEARALVLDMMDGLINEVGVDWIRYDFNMDPLPFWSAHEGPEEKGLAQIRYINGLYEMWADLMRRHPGLLIEQCSSGGRRIDLESIRYGQTFWKSDDTMNQPLMRFHETGGNQFLLGGHLNTNYCRYRTPGEVLSLFAGPLGFGADLRTLSQEETQTLRKAIAAYKQARDFINEDYYALFPQTKDDALWNGWQFAHPGTRDGVFIAYRPETSSYCAATVKLMGLDGEGIYRLEDLMNGTQLAKPGAELAAGFRLDLEAGAAQVWRFSQSCFDVRGGIENSRAIFQNEKRGRVAFIGGSITTMQGWRDLTCAMLRKQFPETAFDFIDAGIGGTNSTLGAFRFEQDAFKNGPVDLLFLEFAVNDDGAFGPGNRPARAIEGIIRRARRLNPKIDIVMQYFVDQGKLAAITNGDTPRIIAEHDRVAAHYGIPILNLAIEMTRRITAGEFAWQQFSNDSCHPTPFGHERYAECIRAFLDSAWAKPLGPDAKTTDHPLPQPLDPLDYENGRMIPLDQARALEGWTRVPAWTTEKTCNYGGPVDVLAAETPDAALELKFEGTVVGMYAIAGMDAGILECRVDDGPPHTIDLFDHYCEMFHRPVLHVFAEDLPGGTHVLKLRMTAEKNEKSTGHAARILRFVVN